MLCPPRDAPGLRSGALGTFLRSPAIPLRPAGHVPGSRVPLHPRLPRAPASPAPTCPRILPFRAHLSGSVPGTQEGEAQGAMSTSRTRRPGPGSRRRRASSALSPTVRGLGTRAHGPCPVASVCAGDQSPLSSRRAISSRPEGFTSGFFTIPASPLRSSGTQEVVHTLNQTDSVQHRLTDNGPRGPGRPRKPHDLRPSGRA